MRENGDRAGKAGSISDFLMCQSDTEGSREGKLGGCLVNCLEASTRFFWGVLMPKFLVSQGRNKPALLLMSCSVIN